MDRFSLGGGIRTTQYGDISVYLFPLPGEGPRDFKHLDDPAMERILVDHFNFMRSGQFQGKVNGRSVSVQLTRGEVQRKRMEFYISFIKVTMLENVKGDDGDTKALLFFELPFHDPAAARRANTNRRAG